MKMAQDGRRKEDKVKFRNDGAPERNDIARLVSIMNFGFGVAKGYGAMSRDRFVVELCRSTTFEKLRSFCEKHLKGSPIPGTDPIHDGPALLQMFQEAEMHGMVKIRFEKAGRFLPEKGMRF